jgi:hypothetical protein
VAEFFRDWDLGGPHVRYQARCNECNLRLDLSAERRLAPELEPVEEAPRRSECRSDDMWGASMMIWLVTGGAEKAKEQRKASEAERWLFERATREFARAGCTHAMIKNPPRR